MTEHREEDLIQPTAQAVTYGSYLKVHELLALQQPLTKPRQHDEMLFIIIHQVYELWFKQILHEVSKATQAITADQLLGFGRIAHRISKIQTVLTSQVDILETMTPVDFNAFRDQLNPASGFQSHQFRVLEFRLGAKDPSYQRFHANDLLAQAALRQALIEPSLYDAFLFLLKKRGFAIPSSVTERDVTQPYTASPEVLAAVVQIYREPERYYDLYSTLESLLDLDEGLLLWRHRHVVMVQRMIGDRMGTGGSSGVKYLTMTLTKRLFPEIWDARNRLGDSRNEYGKDANTRSDEGQQGHRGP